MNLDLLIVSYPTRSGCKEGKSIHLRHVYVIGGWVDDG